MYFRGEICFQEDGTFCLSVEGRIERKQEKGIDEGENHDSRN